MLEESAIFRLLKIRRGKKQSIHLKYFTTENLKHKKEVSSNPSLLRLGF